MYWNSDNISDNISMSHMSGFLLMSSEDFLKQIKTLNLLATQG